MHIIAIPGHEYAVYTLDGDGLSHTFFASDFSEAGRYVIDFITGKFNDDPSLRLFSGHKSVEEQYEADSGQALTSFVISMDDDDCTSGMVYEKKNDRWVRKGFMREIRKGGGFRWLPLTPEEKRVIGKGQIWRMKRSRSETA